MAIPSIPGDPFHYLWDAYRHARKRYIGFSISILGAGGCGKTTFLDKVRQLYGTDPAPTAIPEYWVFIEKGKQIKLHWWDVGGQTEAQRRWQVALEDNPPHVLVFMVDHNAANTGPADVDESRLQTHRDTLSQVLQLLAERRINRRLRAVIFVFNKVDLWPTPHTDVYKRIHDILIAEIKLLSGFFSSSRTEVIIAEDYIISASTGLNFRDTWDRVCSYLK